MTPSTSKLATRRPEQSTLENKNGKDGWEEKMVFDLSCQQMSILSTRTELGEGRPAVHDGRVVLSVLLLAEFDERLLCWQSSSLDSSSTTPAIWGGRVRWFAGGISNSLCLPCLSLLLHCLKMSQRRMVSVPKVSTSSPSTSKPQTYFSSFEWISC